MDGLDLLKKDWKKREGSIPQLSYNEIYKMLWKRSSSIVKWIFVISILEFLFWSILSIFSIDDQYWEQIEKVDLKGFFIVTSIIGYCISFYFIYCFYRNYKRISATDNVAMLIKNILRTRKTVKYYIGYILISTAAFTLIYSYFLIKYHIDNTITAEPEKYAFDTVNWLLFTGTMVLGVAFLLGIIWLFYRLIYGILLRRLNKNYKELKKLEV